MATLTAFLIALVHAGSAIALIFGLYALVSGPIMGRFSDFTWDITRISYYILVAIGVGIAAGVEALEIAAVLSVFFAYATLYIAFFGDGLETHHILRQELIRKEKKRNQKKASAKLAEHSDKQ